MIGQVVSNYRLVSQIGEGGMGLVYLAEHIHLSNRKVAIKALHKQMLSNEQVRLRFRNEAATLSQIEHENIVRIFDYIESDEGYFLVMEFVDGLTLEDYIKNVSGPLNNERSIHVMKMMLKGFGFAHKMGIVHRDVKPSNIIVSNDLSVVKILDFGVAKLLSDSSNMTKHGTQMGTVYYMSPEQVKGQHVDQRSDIYSLGVTLYQMVTGVNPYQGYTTEYDVFNLIVNQSLSDPREIYPGVTNQIVQIINRATQKNVENRYSFCEEMLNDIVADESQFDSTIGKLSNTVDKPYTTDEFLENSDENDDVKKPSIFLWIMLGIIGVGLIFSLLNYKKIKDYFKWKDAEKLYCYIPSLKIRTDTITISDYNVLPIALGYGESVETISSPLLSPWKEARIGDLTGFVNSNFLMTQNDFMILASLLDTEEKEKQIALSKYRKSLVSQINYVSSLQSLPLQGWTLETLEYNYFIKSRFNYYNKNEYGIFLLKNGDYSELVVFIYNEGNEISKKSFTDISNLEEYDVNEYLRQFDLSYR
jgi:serine/threonine protein kinase